MTFKVEIILDRLFLLAELAVCSIQLAVAVVVTGEEVAPGY